jgi:hypothetical protein
MYILIRFKSMIYLSKNNFLSISYEFYYSIILNKIFVKLN